MSWFYCLWRNFSIKSNECVCGASSPGDREPRDKSAEQVALLSLLCASSFLPVLSFSTLLGCSSSLWSSLSSSSSLCWIARTCGDLSFSIACRRLVKEVCVIDGSCRRNPSWWSKEQKVASTEWHTLQQQDSELPQQSAALDVTSNAHCMQCHCRKRVRWCDNTTQMWPNSCSACQSLSDQYLLCCSLQARSSANTSARSRPSGSSRS